MLTIPVSAEFAALPEETIGQISQKATEEINPDEKSTDNAEDQHTNGLIADLAWILLLGAIVTLLFKKMKQPVVLGYILAGFLASPKFQYLPSISNLDNISFWADLGIVVLMFSIGLEFSFKKLMNSGSSAIVTALIIITGMTFAGFGVGCLLGFNTINCIFLGGMISMSSTTIIMKALDDLGLKQKKFASLVLAVLIIEDLFAVLMLVLLSSLAMGDVKGMELLYCIAKLMFFLIIWFLVGVYLIPTFLNRMRTFLNNESLLVVAMALCFTMSIFSVICGFSLELGAFVMGSILAGTVMAERIERVIAPVKNLFGSVFFISVGMMVEPSVLAQYWLEILVLAVVVIVGMILFGTLGMLVTGQNLKVAMESGFTLTQVGEFSFIIASLGMSLGVLNTSLYPIIVAVSVLTIFTTPYFIKMADGAYTVVERHLPQSLQFLISRYSKQSAETDESKQLWKAMLKRYLWRFVLYSVIIIAVILFSRSFLFPILENYFPKWGNLVATVITIAAILPFIIALFFSTTKHYNRMEQRFMDNLNSRENTRLGTNNNLVDDMHQAYILVSQCAPFVGDKIKDSRLRADYGVSVSSIQRGDDYMPLPSPMARIFPGDLLGVIGSDDQLKRLNEDIENFEHACALVPQTQHKVELKSIRLTDKSPIVGMPLGETNIQKDFYSMIVKVQRGGDEFIQPGADMVLKPGDVIWVVGDPAYFDKMK